MTEGVRNPMDPADEPALAPSRGGDLFSKFDALIAERQDLLDTGVRDPFAIVMDEVHSPTLATIQGKETILLGTYNYMGMTFDPDVIEAGKKALDEFGSGTTGSRVLNGTYQGHRECEEALKDYYGTKYAMVFSTGYQANLGLMSTIAGKEDYIILDADSHASIYDGCALGNAQIVRFRHNNVEDLDKRLGRLPTEGGRLVVLEGVYSMLGDIAPLKEMVAVAKKHGAMIAVDEAHGMGFFGPNGRGVFDSSSPTIPSSRSCGWSAAPMSSPPRSRPRWSRPRRPRSASSCMPATRGVISGRIAGGSTRDSATSASTSRPRKRNRRSSRSFCPISRPPS